MTNNIISLIIPIHNESSNINWHHEKIVDHISNLPETFEIIYIDDGSTDN